MHGTLDALTVLDGQLQRRFNFYAEVIEAGGVFSFVGQDPDASAFVASLNFRKYCAA